MERTGDHPPRGTCQKLDLQKRGRTTAPGWWTVERFVDGVDAVRDALALDRAHLLGHSWGGMLALEYGLTRPAGLASLILASTTGSSQQWVAEADRLRTGLSPEVQEILLHHEESATTDDPAYQAAMMAFYERHVCRLAVWLVRCGGCGAEAW